jgi:hypothetical protein
MLNLRSAPKKGRKGMTISEETTTPKQTNELKMTGCGRARSTLGSFCAAANEPLQMALASARR